MNKNTKNCLNCGHRSHCGENCYQDYGEKEKLFVVHIVVAKMTKKMTF